MSIGETAACLVLALLLLILGRIFFKPLKSVFVMLLHSALGGAGLYIFNALLSGAGFGIGLNIVTAAVCGLFGLPGLILLILCRAVFLI